MGFWIAAGLLAVLVAAIIGLALLRPRGSGAWALAAVGLVAVAAYGLFRVLGAPGDVDLSPEARRAMIEEARASRPSQAAAEAENPSATREDTNPERAAMVAQLREVVENTPDAVAELGRLAQEEARLGNFVAARIAQQRLIEVLGAEANAGHYLDLAEIQFMAAGGYVSPETEALLQEVLRRAPGNGAAQYYTGLMYAQQGRPDLGFPIWRDLLAVSEPGDPWIGPIRAQIEAVAELAGEPVSLEDLTQPPDLDPPGPTAEDIAAAVAQGSGAEEAELETMAAGLAERLANLGGPPEDWAQLISAYLVLDRASAARSVYDRALIVFAGSDAALATIRAAAGPLENGE